MPRAIEPRYAAAEDDRIAQDVTVVVGTKDTLSPTVAQLQHLASALPSGVRVIYTYPLPPWEEAKAYARRLNEAAGPALARRMQLLPVDGFSNPFDAWLRALPLVRTKYTLLMHNDVFLLDAGREVFTWIGSKASDAELWTALELDTRLRHVEEYGSTVHPSNPEAW